MTRNLAALAIELFSNIFDEVTEGTDDCWFDIVPSVIGTPQGPASVYMFTIYTRSLLLGSQMSAISAFDQVPSPLLALDPQYVRETVTNAVRFIREQRSQQLASVQAEVSAAPGLIRP